MPAPRKSRQKQAPKYKESDASESGEDFEDSGSEASIPNADSSANSSGEEFEEKSPTSKTKSFINTVKPSTKPRKKPPTIVIKTQKTISQNTLKKNLQLLSSKTSFTNQTGTEITEEPEVLISVKDLTEQEKQLPTFLNLSESDSDDSEDDETKERRSTVYNEAIDFEMYIKKTNEAVAGPSKNIYPEKQSQNVANRLSDSESDCDMEEVSKTMEETVLNTNVEKSDSKKINFQHLHEHTHKLEEAKKSLELYNKRHSGMNKQGMDVGDLLAMGETIEKKTTPIKKKQNKREVDGSDSDIEDLEEVGGENKFQATIPKGGIQLVLDLPTDRPKSKNKALDLEMMMKRRINRVKKEYQTYMHKVHILCWLGHGNFVNNMLNHESVMAAALSLIPSEQCYPSNRVDIKYLEQITKWFSEAIKFKEDKSELKYKPNKRPLNLALLQQIDKKTVPHKKYMVYIFICMLRALGIRCRLVISFRLVPLRPPETELCSLAVKNKDKPKDGKTEKSKHFKPNSCNKKSKDITTNISQLDGADDRDTIRGNRKTRNSAKIKSLVVDKVVSAQQSTSSGTTSTSSLNNSNLSYWDQITQNIIQPENEERVSHKDIRKSNSPLIKIKTEIKEELLTPGNSPNKNCSIIDKTLKLPYVSPAPFTVVKKSLAKSSMIPSKLNLTSSATSIKSKITTKQNPENCKNSSPHIPKDKNVIPSNKRKTTETQTSSESSHPPIINTNTSVPTTTCKGTNKKITSDKSKKLTVASNENLSTSKPKKKVLTSVSLATKCDKNTTSVNANNNKTRTIKAKEVENKLSVPRRSTRGSSVSSNASTGMDEIPSSSSLNKKASKSATEPKKTLASVLSSSLKKSKTLPKKRDTTSKTKSPNIVDSESEIITVKSNQRIARVPKESKFFKPLHSVDDPKSKKSPISETMKSPNGGRVSHRDLAFNAAVNKAITQSVEGASSKSNSCLKTKDILPKSVAKGQKRTLSDCNPDNIVPKKVGGSRRDSNTSEADFKPNNKRKSNIKSKGKKDRRVLSTDDEQSVDGGKKKGSNIWCEVYVEEEEQWICVDVSRGQVHCTNEIYSRTTHPVSYIVSWDTAGHVKDVTRRYVPHWNTITRKLRTLPEWYEKALKPWMAPPELRDIQEDRQLDRMQLDAPLPTSVGEYKNHPLYALKRHLLKFEVIYPPNAVSLGFVRNEAVYARECVHTCRSRETWVKEAKVVRAGEEPYKIVKARPKYDRMSGKMITDIPLEIFGPWQCDEYEPPEAEGGVVPRNPYGNVELFKACMLPKGTVHLQLPGLTKVARKLGIDCAPAMTGFDYHSGWSHPVYDGFVVCEEFKDVITEAWEQEQQEAEDRAREKIDKRVYGNWKRLIRGLFIRERLKAKYDFQSENQTTAVGGSNPKKRSKGPRFIAKKRRSCEQSSDSD